MEKTGARGSVRVYCSPYELISKLWRVIVSEYEFGGRMGCCAFAEIINAGSYVEAVVFAKEWCEANDAKYEYCIKVS